MNHAGTLLDGLRRWEELWRHPRLFCLVHGAHAQRQPALEELRDALLDAKLDEVRPALRAIRDIGDLAAVQAAHAQLADEAGLAYATDALEAARRNFYRRVDQLSARAWPLTARKQIDAVLGEAKRAARDDPNTAEQVLYAAERQIEVAENADAQSLAAAHFGEGEGEDDPRLLGLRSALDARNLRLAHILLSQRSGIVDASAPMTSGHWLGGARLPDLIRWYLDPVQAPGWLQAVDLGEAELLLLITLEELLKADTIDAAKAEQAVRVLLRFLIGGEAEQQRACAWDVRADRSPTDETAAFAITGPATEYLFPQLASDDGVFLLLPLHPAAQLPRPFDPAHTAAWDLFGNWREIAPPETPVFDTRGLVELLGHGDRGAEFVRLLSRGIGIRPLVVMLLGGDERRARQLAGFRRDSQLPDSRTFLTDLLRGLDLYVDEVDIDALEYASSGDVQLLLKILELIVRKLGNAPARDRRLDAIGFMLNPDNDVAVEGIIGDYWRGLLGPSLPRVIATLEQVDFEFELHQFPLDEGVTVDQLAKAIQHDCLDNNIEEIKKNIDHLQEFKLLKIEENDSNNRIVFRNIGRPYYTLLNMHP